LTPMTAGGVGQRFLFLGHVGYHLQNAATSMIFSMAWLKIMGE